MLDFGCGGGIAGVAAAHAGAKAVLAVDIDAIATAATAFNADENGLDNLLVETADLVGEPLDGVEIILAGDICYTEAIAGEIVPWLRGLAAEKTIYPGDPGRTYRPDDGLELISAHLIPGTL